MKDKWPMGAVVGMKECRVSRCRCHRLQEIRSKLRGVIIGVRHNMVTVQILKADPPTQVCSVKSWKKKHVRFIVELSVKWMEKVR